MQSTIGFVAFVLAAMLAQPVVAVTPIQKVVQMLEGMLSKGQVAKHDEAVQFAAYKQFCGDAQAEKVKLIAQADKEIEMLDAEILGYKTEAEDLTKKVAEEQGDLATFEADLKAAQTAREQDRKDYEEVHKSYTESIEAIGQAVQVLKAQANKGPRAQAAVEELVQLKLPKQARRAIDAFLARGSDDADPELSVLAVDQSAPEAYGYEFQSSGVIDMLLKLKDKFFDERATIEKEELKKNHAFKLFHADTADSIKNTKASITAKSQQIARDHQMEAEKTGDLTETKTTKASDEQYLKETKQTCDQKDKDFEERQKLREDELTAIQQAIAVLSSDDVMGAGKKHLPGAFPQISGKGAMLMQLQRQEPQPSNQIRVAAYLHDEGTRLHSSVLSALSIRVREDPFAKVKKMIRDLINRLEEQAGEEAKHDAWCRTELATNKATRDKKTSEVDNLGNAIEELTANKAKTILDIKQLESDLAELEINFRNETEMRAAEKEKNEATIKDAQDAQTAVGQAQVILRNFYSKAAESTVLVQAHKQDPVAPPIFDSPYKGQGPDGVLSMLEVIQSDFARLEAETTSAEQIAEKEWQDKKTATLVDKAAKSASIDHKKKEVGQMETMLTEKKADLTTTSKELNAANEYYEKLKPSCVETGMTYEERNQRRQEEIQSLEEALRILNGEDLTGLMQAS